MFIEDSAAMAGVMVAGAGILASQLTGGAAFVLIGLILADTAIWLAVETKGLLIGESANRPVVQGIRRIVASHEKAQHINELLTIHIRPGSILVNVSVDFRDPIDAAGMEQAVFEIDARIKERFTAVRRIFIEAEAHATRIRKAAGRESGRGPE